MHSYSRRVYCTEMILKLAFVVCVGGPLEYPSPIPILWSCIQNFIIILTCNSRFTFLIDLILIFYVPLWTQLTLKVDIKFGQRHCACMLTQDHVWPHPWDPQNSSITTVTVPSYVHSIIPGMYELLKVKFCSRG